MYPIHTKHRFFILMYMHESQWHHIFLRVNWVQKKVHTDFVNTYILFRSCFGYLFFFLSFLIFSYFIFGLALTWLLQSPFYFFFSLLYSRKLHTNLFVDFLLFVHYLLIHTARTFLYVYEM